MVRPGSDVRLKGNLVNFKIWGLSYILAARPRGLKSTFRVSKRSEVAEVSIRLQRGEAARRAGTGLLIH